MISATTLLKHGVKQITLSRTQWEALPSRSEMTDDPNDDLVYKVFQLRGNKVIPFVTVNPLRMSVRHKPVRVVFTQQKKKKRVKPLLNF
jgi:hypothetical protein